MEARMEESNVKLLLPYLMFPPWGLPLFDLGYRNICHRFEIILAKKGLTMAPEWRRMYSI